MKTVINHLTVNNTVIRNGRKAVNIASVLIAENRFCDLRKLVDNKGSDIYLIVYRNYLTV